MPMFSKIVSVELKLGLRFFLFLFFAFAALFPVLKDEEMQGDMKQL